MFKPNVTAFLRCLQEQSPGVQETAKQKSSDLQPNYSLSFLASIPDDVGDLL
ncbi:unnamed protein product [Ixodes pacificus]